MDAKTQFIIGICGFFTSLASLLATVPTWQAATSPAFVSAIIGLAASFMMTAYGGAGFTTKGKADEMMSKAIQRVLEHQQAQKVAEDKQGIPSTAAAAAIAPALRVVGDTGRVARAPEDDDGA